MWGFEPGEGMICVTQSIPYVSARGHGSQMGKRREISTTGPFRICDGPRDPGEWVAILVVLLRTMKAMGALGSLHIILFIVPSHPPTVD